MTEQFPGGSYLDTAVAEIETHVSAAGWDQPPQVYALVRAAQVATEDPDVAARLGIDRLDPDMLTPIEQAELPAGQLDEVLAQIEWPPNVAGCAVSQEIVILPPEAEAEAELDGSDALARAAAHPERREARLVVGVTRGGASTTLLRMRGDGEDELLSGTDLAPGRSHRDHVRARASPRHPTHMIPTPAAISSAGRSCAARGRAGPARRP